MAHKGKNFKKTWTVLYFTALAVGLAGLLLGLRLGASAFSVYAVAPLSAIFGAYFCFFIQEKLPRYYDENRISGIHEGAFRINVPGLYFNNRNWPYIILVGRIWSCAALALYPLLNAAMSFFAPGFWEKGEPFICLILLLGGLFIPMYVVGKKYE